MIRRVEVRDAVVFVGPDAAEVGAAVRLATDGGERAAGLVGPADDPLLAAALDELAAELFPGG